MIRYIIFLLISTSISFSQSDDSRQPNESEKRDLIKAIEDFYSQDKFCIEINKIDNLNDPDSPGFLSEIDKMMFNHLESIGYMNISKKTSKMKQGDYSYSLEKNEYSLTDKFYDKFDIIPAKYHDFICFKDAKLTFVLSDEPYHTYVSPSYSNYPPSIMGTYDTKLVNIDKFYLDNFYLIRIVNNKVETIPSSSSNTFYITDQGYIDSVIFHRSGKK